MSGIIPELPAALADDRVITLNQTAQAANVHPRTLRRYIIAGTGPRVIQLGMRKRGVRVRDLKAWLESRAAPTDAA